MKKIILLLALTFHLSIGWSQIVTTSPVFPIADQPVTITVDVSGTSLDHYAWNNSTSPVWIWSWISEGCTSGCDALTNVDPATSPAQDAAKCVRISTNPDKYQVTFTPTTFFNKPASDLKKIGIKLKTKSWSDNKQTDTNKIIELNTGILLVNFTSPSQSYVFKNQGDQINITANSTTASTLTLKINGITVSTVDDATTLSYQHTISESSGTSSVTIDANNGTETQTASFSYVVRTLTQTLSRPNEIIDGINYNADDKTKVTLSLFAPLKTSVYVMGDFNDWAPVQMVKDNEHYWIEITDLTAGQEYAFQYLIDETLAVADPYADKVLDPSNDQYITATTYPDLKTFPKAAKSIVSVFQTDQPEYNWQTNNFVKPERNRLTIYELLIRDFDANQSYQSVIDRLDYIKELGINAIELMPIMEFSGNNSWGYNPIFYFAADKAYGTKNKLKELIDKAHAKGMAVILDMVLNQADYECPLVKMYWDTDKPAANNPWFNPVATHPFSVFFDFNHESVNTQNFVDRVTEYWIKVYHFDGYRFDLSKGFTQKNTGTDVAAWSAYDPSRIAILERMADKIWAHTPDAYVILEHLGVNAEEKELAEYRANDGKGMMLWGKMTQPYSLNARGTAPDSDLGWAYYENRNWTVPHLVTYMESHDEERLMYSNLTSGNSSGTYNTKSLKTALKRMKATDVNFYTLPGPKMLWQFGEYGYDQSITLCENGTFSSGCNVSPKPIKWDYLDNSDRLSLKNHVADIIRLRNTYHVFTDGNATLSGGNTLSKQITIKNNPYTESPVNENEMNAQVATNFGLTTQNLIITFPHTGTWYEYYSGSEIQVTSSSATLSMEAGEYKLFTDIKIDNPTIVTAVDPGIRDAVRCYPNPATSNLIIESDLGPVQNVILHTMQGEKAIAEKKGGNLYYVGDLSAGIYIAEVTIRGKTHHIKFIKK